MNASEPRKVSQQEWVALEVEVERLRKGQESDTLHRMRLIEQMVAALNLGDDTTDDEAVALLDGCDCNGEGGSVHLLWHLIQQRDALVDGRDMALEMHWVQYERANRLQGLLDRTTGTDDRSTDA